MSETKKAVYGSIVLDFPADTSSETIRQTLALTYPELANADILEGDGTITFKVKSGTKGATIAAKYNDVSVDFPEGTSVETIRQTLSLTYPELANAEHTVSAGAVTFKVKSGTKGN